MSTGNMAGEQLLQDAQRKLRESELARQREAKLYRMSLLALASALGMDVDMLATDRFPDIPLMVQLIQQNKEDAGKWRTKGGEF